MTSDLTKSIPFKATTHTRNSAPSTSKSQHWETQDLGESESEEADDELEDSLESESESEVGKEVPSGMESENDNSGPAEPPEDDEFNVDDKVDINSPILRKIIGQDLTTAATASKTTHSLQPISTNTSFEMNDKDFNRLWEP